MRITGVGTPTVFTILCFNMLLVSCSGDKSVNESPGSDNVQRFNPLTLSPGQVVSLSPSLPIFAMRYDGDYGFQNLILKSQPMRKIPPIEIPEPVDWQCTAFAAFGDTSNPYFGRNFDWIHSGCLILYTDSPYAYASISIVDPYYCAYVDNPSLEELLEGQYLDRAPFYPGDGINENGVAVAYLSAEADPPYDPSLPSLSAMQITRLVLDYGEDTEHAISLVQSVNFEIRSVPEHFIIADAAGHSAIIEYVNGAVVVLRNDLPFQVCTNFVLTGSGAPQVSHCSRFDFAYQYLEESEGTIDATEGMNILESVHLNNDVSRTMWSAVYNLQTLCVDLAFERDYEFIFRIEFPR